MDNDQIISYQTAIVDNYADMDPSYQWIPLKAFETGILDHDAGFIQIKLSCNSLQRNGLADWKSLNAWKRNPPRRLGASKVRCFIFQCRGLQTASGDEASPFVSVFDSDGKPSLTTIRRGANPIFEQIIDVSTAYAKLENAPPMVISVWDQQSTIDFIGRAIVNIGAIPNVDNETLANEIPQPQWYPIHRADYQYDQNVAPIGEVLCSFVVCELDFDLTPKEMVVMSNIVIPQ